MISSVRTLTNPKLKLSKARGEFVKDHRELIFVESQQEDLQITAFSKAVLRRDRGKPAGWKYN